MTADGIQSDEFISEKKPNAFDRINLLSRAIQIAASFFDAPIAVLSLVNAEESESKTHLMTEDDKRHYGQSSCKNMEVPSNQSPNEFSNFQFCVSAPLQNAEGKMIGSLRVLDHRARLETKEQRKALTDLAKSVSKELHHHGSILELEQTLADRDQTIEVLTRYGERLEDFLTTSSDITWELDANLNAINGGETLAHDSDALEKTVFEYPNSDHEDNAIWISHREDLIARRPFRAFVFSISQADGSIAWLEGNGNPVFDEKGQFQGYRGTSRNISKRRIAEDKIAFMARHDATTNLLNRAALRERIEHGLKFVGEFAFMALLYLDLDNFKSINDIFGYPIGNKLLQETATRLLAWGIRETDTVACLGGDEFALLQVGLQRPELAGPLAQRILEVIRSPYEIDGHKIIIGASIGISVTSDEQTNSDALLKCADIALYRAKADGRGTYRFFEPEMDSKLQEQHELEVSLREALDRDEFELFYQPIVNIKTEEMILFEALIRWNHPDRGVVSPAEFILLAEDTGLIAPIGEWVIRNAIMEAKKWPEHIKVSINLSPAQFKDPNMVGVIKRMLDLLKVTANRVEFEITESLLLKKSASIMKMLTELHSMGIGISMDDFGTGFSSLTNLRNFPFDRIKIDQSFIQDLPLQPAAVGIVRAVIALGKALGMDTVAEGVENEAQFALLKAEGCDAVQGYYFHRPMSAENVRSLVGAVR